MRCSLVVLVAAGLVAACSAPHGDPDRCAALPLRHEALQALERRLPPEVATVLFEEHMGFRLGALLSQPPLATEEIRHFATRESVEGDPVFASLLAHPDIGAALDPATNDWAHDHWIVVSGWAREDLHRHAIDGDELVLHVGRTLPCIDAEDRAWHRDYAWTTRVLRIPAVASVRIERHEIAYRMPTLAPSDACVREPDRPFFRSAGASGAVLKRDEEYLLWFEGYSAMTGNWFLSRSPDGFDWDPEGWDEDRLCRFEGHSPYADHYDPTVVATNAGFDAWYGKRRPGSLAVDVIAHSRSEDGIAFGAESIALEPGPPGSWDDRAVHSPSVLAHDGRLWLWYAGESDDEIPRIGLAISEDGGATWQRVGDGPVLEPGPPGSFDELGVSDPEVRHDGERFHLWMTAFAGGGNVLVPWRTTIGHAVSTDGIHWEKDPAPVLVPARQFEGAILGQPAVLLEGGGYRLWYTGVSRRSEPSIGHARCSF